MAGTEKKSFLDKIYQTAKGLFSDEQPKPPSRVPIKGPKSSADIMTMERQPHSGFDAKKFEKDFDLMPLIGEKEANANRLKQFTDTFGVPATGERGVQRAIIPNTFGQPGDAYPAAEGSGRPLETGPEGFASIRGGMVDPLTDKGGRVVGPAQTYVPVATHTGPTHFPTALEDDREFENYQYNLKKGMLPEGTSWEQYAESVLAQQALHRTILLEEQIIERTIDSVLPRQHPDEPVRALTPDEILERL